MTNGLPTMFYRGQRVRTYVPKRTLPERIDITRRTGNEALLSFLNNPQQLDRASLKSFILANGEALAVAAEQHRSGTGGFSIRPIYPSLPPSRFEEAIQSIRTGAIDKNLFAQTIAEAIFCRLGPPKQVLDRISKTGLRNLEWVFSEERNITGRKNRTKTINKGYFDGLNLSELNLSMTQFRYCSFNNTNLSHTDFRGASFLDCDFEGADLSGANFSSAEFANNTSLINALLSNADFTFAVFNLSNPPVLLRGMRGIGIGKFFARVALPQYAEDYKKISKDGFQVC